MVKNIGNQKHFVGNIPLKKYCLSVGVSYNTIINNHNKFPNKSFKELIKEVKENTKRVNEEDYKRCTYCQLRNCCGCKYLRMEGEK